MLLTLAIELASKIITEMKRKESINMSNAFDYAHLPAHLQEVSKPVGELAELMKETLPDSAEKSAGLRKLLEAKDCFVRAKLQVTI